MAKWKEFFSERHVLEQILGIGVPILLVVLLMSLIIYGFRSYRENQERQVGYEVHALIDDFDAIEFDKASLAYEEELQRLTAAFRKVYEEATGTLNGKRALYHAGMTAYLRQDFKTAEQIFAELLAEDIKFYLAPQTLLFRALALEELEQFQEAIIILDTYDSLYKGASFIDREVTLSKIRNYAWLGDESRVAELAHTLIGEEDVFSAEPVTPEERIQNIYGKKSQELIDLLIVTGQLKLSS